jgi:hypothetical protein
MPTPYAEHLLKIRDKPTPPNRRDEDPAPPKSALARLTTATRLISYLFHPKGGVLVEAHQTVWNGRPAIALCGRARTTAIADESGQGSAAASDAC